MVGLEQPHCLAQVRSPINRVELNLKPNPLVVFVGVAVFVIRRNGVYS